MRATLILLVLSVMSCKSQWYGTSNVYAFNGSESVVRLQLEGTDKLDVTLRPSSGELLHNVTAGPYTITTKHEGGGANKTLRTELRKGDLTILNVDGIGCFTRADYAGKYSPDRHFPVQVVTEYSKDETFRIDTPIEVLPGELLPNARPKSNYGFYRVIEVPCELIGDRPKLTEHLKGLR
ncbi:MAG: hypothetical protein H7Z43_03145 [Clostridia bacterium]|nr:hypothetical protein [Deltaproteobacteria bacterium]